MTPSQRAYLDALQEMLLEGVSTIAWKVCERAGFAQGSLSKWKKEYRQAIAEGREAPHQDFWDEEKAIKDLHRSRAAAERALEPEIVEPESEEMPEVLVAYLTELEADMEKTGKLDRYGAFTALSTAGWQVSFEDLMDAIDGAHKGASRRFRQLKRRTTVRLEDKLRAAASTGTRSQDNSLALQILRVDDPERWNPKATVSHVFQLEESDRRLIEDQRGWFKDVIRKIPASAGADRRVGEP